MRIPIRTSRWAIWARRTASLALPIEVIPIFMHRERMIPSDSFAILFGLGLVLAFIAVIVSLIAFVRLWQSGFRGWGRTFLGLILGGALLSPAVVGMSWAMTYPLANDVVTTGPEPSLAIVHNPYRLRLSRSETARFFPNAVARTYPLDPDTLFELVDKLVTARQWEARIRRDPVSATNPGRIHALAMTMLGFRDEVALLIDKADNGAEVSMRSASVFGMHDLGANGLRIEAFLTDLDTAVTEALREAPIIEGLTPGEGAPDQ